VERWKYSGPAHTGRNGWRAQNIRSHLERARRL